MKKNLQLPFFSGFYESHYMNSDTAYWAIKEELDYHREELGDTNLEEYDLDFDYKAYEQEVCEAFCGAFLNNAPMFIEGVKFQELWSPQYYNYDTDHIYADVELSDDWKEKMRAFMDANWFELSKRIDDDWSCRDGFISFMENRIDDWPTKLFEEEDERYISTMIGYMMEFKNKNIYDELVNDTLEDIYAGSYVYVKEDKK